jgi:hypothetical protein
MKKIFLFVCLLLVANTYAQKEEKIKGSKIVTIERNEIESFNTLEVEQDFEVLLIKGSKANVEVEADDNLHEVITKEVIGGVLYLRKTKKIVSAKKISIRITYTDDLKIINSRNKSKITALESIKLKNLQVNGYENAELFLNAEVNAFSMNLNDKSSSELNLKADTINVILDKNAKIKALLNSKKIKFDMYQKTTATIEGDCENLQLRMDNNARFTGENLITKKLFVLAEMSSKTYVQHTENAKVEARGKAEIYFYGNGKIVLDIFEGEASIHKKTL